MNNIPELRFPEFEEEWENKKLGEIFKLIKTNSFSRNQLNYRGGFYNNIHYGDIHMYYPSVLNLDNKDLPFVNKDLDSKISTGDLCKEGDLIFADASEDYDYIGKATELKNVKNKNVVSGLHTIVARDKNGIMAGGFKGYVANSQSVHYQIKIMANGAKVLGITKENIKKVEISMPSKKEQTKIANFFSLIDQKIEKQQEKVEVIEEWKKGLMQKIFNQDIRFKDGDGEFFGHWTQVTIKNLGEVITGNTPKTSVRSNYGGDFMFVSPADMGENKYIMETEKKISKQGFKSGRKIPKESVLVTCIGSTIGKIGMSSDELITNQQINSIIVKEHIDANYIFYALKYYFPTYLNMISKQAVPIINKSQFQKLELSLPCNKEQIKIANLLSTMDQKIDKEKKKLEGLKEMKKGLMQRMFV